MDSHGLYVLCELDETRRPVLSFEGEELLQTFDNITMVVDEKSIGTGNLFVTSRRAAWVPDDSEEYGYFTMFRSIGGYPMYWDNPSLTISRPLGLLGVTPPRMMIQSYSSAGMHAISREDKPTLYCQISGPNPFSSNVDRVDTSDDDGEGNPDAFQPDVDECTEVKFIPKDASCLDSIFEAFNHSASLNPDDDSEDEDGANGEGAGFFFNGEEALANAESLAMMERLDALLSEEGGEYEAQIVDDDQPPQE